MENHDAITTMRRQLNQALHECDDVVNCGKLYDVGARQKKSESWLNFREQLMLLSGLVNPLALYTNTANATVISV